VQFGEAIRDWNLKIIDMKGATLWTTSGTGIPDSDIVWRVKKIGSDTASRQKGEQLTATLSAGTDGEGQVVAVRNIPVRRTVRSQRFSGEVVRDSVLERYALMFFDFDTPNVSDFNTQVVRLIQGRVQTNSAVRITGLTDRIGESDYNLSLSKQRAESSARRIQSRIVPEAISTKGAGETLIYNNDLPEGRFYNRTVIVEIATPVEDAL
jgi:outer membrane protein OmpA-like peptidoglycan-associated protein